eukprot:985479-Pleurochrysis_carterae.AAC.1
MSASLCACRFRCTHAGAAARAVACLPAAKCAFRPITLHAPARRRIPCVHRGMHDSPYGSSGNRAWLRLRAVAPRRRADASCAAPASADARS